MRASLLLSAGMLAVLPSFAQTTITDTVVLGAGYANQIWYHLPTDEVGSQLKNNWDLGFRISGSMSSDILVNTTGSGAIWRYDKGNAASWASVDTNGLSTWPGLYNSEKAWIGALGRYTDPSNAFDLGWGLYDMGTHNVIGDSIYIVRTQTGSFKKLLIEKLASSTYTFRFANLDGSSESTATLSKSAYAGKKYAYFNLDSKTPLDREPLTDNWDLLFGQYPTADYASMGIAGYTVTGVLANDTLKIAPAVVDPSLRTSYAAYTAHAFSEDINGMGYNWKTTAGVIRDSNVYFVRRNNGDFWKICFTGWISGVSGNGSVIFNKTQLTSTGIKEQGNQYNSFALAPNPANSLQFVQFVYHFEAPVTEARVLVNDYSGRVVYSADLESASGMHVHAFRVGDLSAGIYIVTLVADGERIAQKLIIQ